MKRLLTLTTIFTFLLLPLAALGQVVNPPSGGGAPSGPAGGDLSGTYPNPTVTGAHINAGTINTAIIGGTTPAAITGTTVTASTALVTTLNANPNAPNIYATSDATTGISISPFTGDTLFISGGVATAGLAGNSGNLRLFMGNSTALQWTSGDNVASTGATLGLSQDASNVMDCGNGTFQNKSCTLNLATINASASLNATTDGVHAGILSLVGNTTNPTIPANQFGWLGFPSTSATAYFLQPSTTAPNGNFLQCAAPSGGISTCSWASAGGGALPTGTTGQTVFYATGGTTGTATSATTTTSASAGFPYGIGMTPVNSLDVAGTTSQISPYTGTVTLGATFNATATSATISGGAALNPNGGFLIVGYQDGSNDQEIICYSAATSTTLTIAAPCGTPVTTIGRSYFGTTAASHASGNQIVQLLWVDAASITSIPRAMRIGNGGNGDSTNGSLNPTSLGHSTGAMFGNVVYFLNGGGGCWSASPSVSGGDCILQGSGSMEWTNGSNNPAFVTSPSTLDYAIATQGITGNGTLTAITNAKTPTMPNNNTTAAAGAGGVLSSHCTIIWNQATAGTVAFGIKASAAPTGIWVKEQDSGGTYTAPAYTTITSTTTTQTSGTVVPSAFGTTFASDLWIAMNPGTSNSASIQLYASASLNTLTIEPGTGCTAWE